MVDEVVAIDLEWKVQKSACAVTCMLSLQPVRLSTWSCAWQSCSIDFEGRTLLPQYDFHQTKDPCCLQEDSDKNSNNRVALMQLGSSSMALLIKASHSAMPTYCQRLMSCL